MSNYLSQAKARHMEDARQRQELITGIRDYLLADITDKLQRATKCCPNCTHFLTGTPTVPMEICQLASARPPAKVIAFGCERYEDCIPF